ncbi:hypothetical protein [Aliiglaciecola lipolytica]|uniref:Uncharacterized protein n=1 Tax=Aliiglaciecola lipolytica E3 TaxID=1127673 RepID=K6X222_9ALTE|nr:hypothetical protein [Aliiglaciecola lipolytica]GAC14709.1 hypothetical protein GLIP_2081 [Aliiglaciecola lipolytica E3]
MEVGSSSSSTAAQAAPQQQARQVDTQQRQAELESPRQSSTTENNPTPDSRVGSVINTQA